MYTLDLLFNHSLILLPDESFLPPFFILASLICITINCPLFPS